MSLARIALALCAFVIAHSLACTMAPTAPSDATSAPIDPLPLPYQCTLEESFCGMVQPFVGTKGIIKWQRWYGTTPTKNTGPVGDHTTGNGIYAYIESSAPARQNYRGVLVTPPLLSSGPYCLSFWYNMHGATIGVLNVYEVTNLASQKLVWSRPGEQGPDWRKAFYIGNVMGELQIAFEAVVGDVQFSDIAIDDLYIAGGPATCTSSEMAIATAQDALPEPFEPVSKPVGLTGGEIAAISVGSITIVGVIGGSVLGFLLAPKANAT